METDFQKTKYPQIGPYGWIVFTWATLISFSGAICYYIGIAAAFDRAGNWSNDLAGIGIYQLFAGGILNLIAFVWGIYDTFKYRNFGWWIIFSVPLAAMSIWAAMAASGF